MPELPDIETYLSCLRPRIVGRSLIGLTLRSPFLLRSVEPAVSVAEGREVCSVSRLGKRIVIHLEEDLALVLHLMIAGRLHWKPPGSRPTGRIDLAALSFEEGTLVITEAAKNKRASLHVVAGAEHLAEHDPGGIEPLECDLETFTNVLRGHNHTIKRALTMPRLIAGIGNAYSDEILHAAKLSPIKWTSRLTDDEIARLFESMRATLLQWIDTLTTRFANRFPGPGNITAFRPEFAVHGKSSQPCPVCETKVQRIVRAENEINYCPRCQTDGKVLADRSLSRLLRDDWPRTVDEWE